MKYSLEDKELKDLKKNNKDESVKKLILFYESICNDDSVDFYFSLKNTIKILSGDLDSICEGNDQALMILGNDKDDKLFERVRTLIVDCEKIFGGLKKGRESILMPLAEKDDLAEKPKKITKADKAIV